MVPESLSVNGLSGVVGKLFRVMSLFPGVSERSWSRGRVLLARTNGLLPWLLTATSEQNVQSHRPGTLVTGVDAVARSVHGPLWCSGWREEGGGVVYVGNPLCPAHLPQIGRRPGRRLSQRVLAEGREDGGGLQSCLGEGPPV